MAEERSKSGGFLVALGQAVAAALIAGGVGWAIVARDAGVYQVALAAGGAILFLALAARGELANLGRYINATLYAAFVLGTCVCAYILVARHDRQIDLTPQRVHTLAEGTQKLLSLLRKDVQVVVFDALDRDYRPLLDRYAAATPKLTWTLQDPRKDPAFSAQFDSKVDLQTLYIRCGDKIKKLVKAELNEAALTNGIVEVTRDRKTKVCFLSGHGEMELNETAESKEKAPLGELRAALNARAIETEDLPLLQEGFIPADAAAIVIAAPMRDLYAVEETQIEEYLSKGGRLLVYLDLPRQGEKVGYERLDAILRRRGIDDQEYVVLDAQGKRLFGSRLTVPILWYNPKHPITEPLTKMSGPTNALPLARSLTAADPMPPKIEISALIGSSDEAWDAPYQEALNGGAQTPPGKAGPKPLGLAVEEKLDPTADRPPMRLIAFGSSDLANGQFVSVSSTAMALALNSVSWLAEQDDLISIPPKTVAGTPLLLDDGQLRLVLLLLAVALPGLVFFGGISYSALAKRG